MSDIFEDRFVVFIDILGFGSMVAAAAKDQNGETARRVDSALTMIQGMQLSNEELKSQDLIGYQCHMFSDCVVLSVPLNSYAVSKLFVALAKLTVKLMSIGVWIRGGMSVGAISKRMETPWGPAIVEAYKIESELALNPRIALSKSALNYVREAMNHKEKDQLILRDSDGVWALAPFAWALRESYGEKIFLTAEVADKIKSHLEKAFVETVDNPSVFRKIDWLSHAWDNHVKPKDGFPEFDSRTKHGKERDLVDAFQRGLDNSTIDGGSF